MVIEHGGRCYSFADLGTCNWVRYINSGEVSGTHNDTHVELFDPVEGQRYNTVNCEIKPYDDVGKLGVFAIMNIKKGHERAWPNINYCNIRV